MISEDSNLTDFYLYFQSFINGTKGVLVALWSADYHHKHGVVGPDPLQDESFNMTSVAVHFRV